MDVTGAPEGFRHVAAYLDQVAQTQLVGLVLERIDESFWFQPTTPRWNRPFSVRMSNLGALGWVSDTRGYRYQPDHPDTRLPWPSIPVELLRIWHDLTSLPDPPDACLVNLYRGNARMGLHQDKDELDLTLPVLSVSLGDEAVFRIGGLKRSDPTSSLRLCSGDLCLLGGKARLAYHGIDRILPGSSDLVPGGGRLNLTLRCARVTTGRR